MSAEYAGQDPLEIAKQAERDLNSHEAKHGHGGSTSGMALFTPLVRRFVVCFGACTVISAVNMQGLSCHSQTFRVKRQRSCLILTTR